MPQGLKLGLGPGVSDEEEGKVPGGRSGRTCQKLGEPEERSSPLGKSLLAVLPRAPPFPEGAL